MGNLKKFFTRHFCAGSIDGPEFVVELICHQATLSRVITLHRIPGVQGQRAFFGTHHGKNATNYVIEEKDRWYKL